MANSFVKGRTNQHLSWAMVDSTDFATPESALSAATKIKIWGKLRGATGVNFVTSGTGSLVNDIQHIGPSVLGLYTIALTKADLSDASAAWYDQYVISLSATGAAYQALVVDGGIDASAILAAAVQGNSRVLVVQSQASDTYSALIAPLASMTSDIASAVWAHAVGARVDSRILVVQSQASDAYSAIIAPLASMTSDVASAVWAHAVGTRVDSRILVGQSFLSDIRSQITAGVPIQASDMSDLRSAITAGPTPTITASDMSDIASRVWAEAAGAALTSRVLVMKSTLSDAYSMLSDMQSDFQSRVPKRVATDSQLSDVLSDLRSFIGAGVPMTASDMSDLRSAIAAGPAATITASDISDIASAVWANTIGARVDSRLLVVKSQASDIASYLVAMSGVLSDVYSAASNINSVAASSPTTTTLASAVWANSIGARVDSRILVGQSFLSDIKSAIAGVTATVSASDMSDIASRVWATSEGAAVSSRLLLAKSSLSDIISALAAGVTVSASDMSDIRSAVAAVTAAVSASDMSDIASRVWAMAAATTLTSRMLVVQSMASDAASAAQQANSRVLVTQSMASDLQSKLSDVESNLLSVLGTTGVQLNASTMSDLRSAIAGLTFTLSASDISDIASAVLAGAGTTSISASDMSDIASRVWAMSPATTLTSRMLVVQSMASDAASAAQQANSRVLVVQSQASDVYSALIAPLASMTSDVASAVWAHATGARLDSRMLLTQSMASDAASAAQQANSRALVVQSMVSDTQSKLSDVESNLLSLIGTTGVQLNASTMSDLRSAITATTFTLGPSDISDIASAVVAAQASDHSDILSAVRKANSQLLVAQSLLSDVQSAVAVIPGTKLAQHAAGVLALVIGSGSTTTTVKLSTIEGGSPSAVNDFYNGRVVIFTSGALSGQATSISDYDGATTTATVVALTGAPVNAVTAVIV
jgi:hypothetical protein